jgi:hypothetical protein
MPGKNLSSGTWSPPITSSGWSRKLGSVPEIRNAFERQKDIEYSISSISGKDLEITKENERVVIKFGYDKEIELIAPVYLVIKYRGRSQ